MPVEIRELMIRAIVEEEPESEGGEDGDATVPDAGMMIEECVEQVLKILKASAER